MGCITSHWRLVTFSLSEQYIRECFPLVKKCLGEMGVSASMDAVEGSMTVTTTRKAYDPMSILNARDLIKLLARRVDREPISCFSPPTDFKDGLTHSTTPLPSLPSTGV